MVTKTIRANIRNIGDKGYNFVVGCSICTSQPRGSGCGIYGSGEVTDLSPKTEDIAKGQTKTVSFGVDIVESGTFYAIVKIWEGPGTTNCLDGDWKAFTVTIAEEIGAEITGITII